MDVKLARGLTRHGFRQDKGAHEHLTQDGMDALLPSLIHFKTRGRLNKGQAKSLMAKATLLKSDPHYTVFLEQFSSPSIKALSPNFDQAIAGGALMPGTCMLSGHEEKVRTFSLFYERVRLSSFEHRFFDYSVFVREHGIARFMERTGADFRSVAAALWPSLLLLELIDGTANGAIDTFILPTAGGAFLGLRMKGEVPQEHQQTVAIVVSKDNTQTSVLGSDRNARSGAFFINTFVEEGALRPSQQDVCAKLHTLIKRNYSALLNSLLSKIMLRALDEDTFGLNDRFPRENLEAAIREYQSLIARQEWQEAAPLPRDSVFNRHSTTN